MKNISIKIFTILIAAIAFVGCEKEEDHVTFQGGTAPVLTISSTDDLVLQKEEEFFQSLQFQWTNPAYDFSNGPNTHDVNYVLEVTPAGTNFEENVASIAIPRGTSKTFTVKEFNALIATLELADYEPHDFQFRVKSSLASTGAVPMYSNVETIAITTYLDVVYPVPDRLFITGAATPEGWMGGGAADVPAQEFTKINPYTFEIASLALNGGSGFLFVIDYGSWDNTPDFKAKYGFTGDKEKNNTGGDSFKPDGSDFLSPASAAPKNYKITVNFKTGKYSLTAL